VDTNRLPERAEVVIAGGGFAGASTACFLARRGCTDVLLLDAAEQFGMHSSGLNAAMVRQLVPDPFTSALLRTSTKALLDPHWPEPVDVAHTGSLLLVGEGEAGEALLATTRAAVLDGLDATVLSPAEARERVPVLEGARFRAAIATASDGVVDIHALLWRFLKEAKRKGARVETRAPIEEVEVQSGRVRAVRTPRGRVECRVVVDAAGAWANAVAARAGLAPLPMTPYRRHIAVTPALEWVDPAWPFVWHATEEWYFRPEVGGLMVCPCDQEAMEPPVTRSPAALELLAEKFAAGAPRLAGLSIKTWWAGLRTITRDGRFVIGADPRLKGFFWAAGLGGHGMTGSSITGEISAAAVLGEPAFPELAPARFL
jgi:glycine/D-amino acid oxidase-like deaminating enzyme